MRVRVATTLGAVLLLAALAAPTQSFAGFTKGPYAGNTTREFDEALSFQVTKSKGKNGKRKIKVKNLDIETIVLDCTLTPFPGDPGPVERYFTAQFVPIGDLFEGKNAATVVKKTTKKKRKGSFSLEMRSHRHLDEGQHVRFNGKLSKESAEGRLLVRYNTYHGDGQVSCDSGSGSTGAWEASPVG